MHIKAVLNWGISWHMNLEGIFLWNLVCTWHMNSKQIFVEFSMDQTNTTHNCWLHGIRDHTYMNILAEKALMYINGIMGFNSLRLSDAYVCLVNWVTTISGDGLSPVWHQAITLTSAELIQLDPYEKNHSDYNWHSNIFIQENEFENVICKMSGILSRLQCVSNFQGNFSGWQLRYQLWNCSQMNVSGPCWW